MFNCLLLFFFFYSSFVFIVWAVTCLLKQGCSYSYTNITPVLRYLRLGLPRCYLVMSDVGVLLSKQLLFSDRMVHLWIFPHSRPPQKPQTRYPSPVPLLLVTSSSPRGSPQCIAFKRYCTCQHLTAVQRNVCHAKGVFCTTSLAISAKDFAAAFKCLFDITKKERKKKNYELQTVIILLLLLLVLLLFKYFRDCSASVNADSQLHL